MRSKLSLSLAAAALGATPFLAEAAHPVSIAGTWSIVANQSAGSMTIAQASSSAVCKPVTGSILGSSLEGYYCPSTGRLVFARKGSANIPFQFYEAHVSRDASVDRLGGSFAVWNADGGGFTNEGVDYGFYGAK